MATIDFGSVQADMAKLRSYQASLNQMAPNDPGRGLLQAEISALQESITQEMNHASAQADATANMFTQLQWTQALGQTFSTLGAALPTVITLLK